MKNSKKKDLNTITKLMNNSSTEGYFFIAHNDGSADCIMNMNYFDMIQTIASINEQLENASCKDIQNFSRELSTKIIEILNHECSETEALTNEEIEEMYKNLEK